MTARASSSRRCSATAAWSAPESLPGSHVSVIEIDVSGRIWVATDRGLSVLEPNGHVVGQSTAGELPGLTGWIDMVVVGSGPASLPAPAEVTTRTLIGHLLLPDDAPLSGVRVELCTDSSCRPASRVATTTSAHDGSFRFDEVPDGHYYVNVNTSEVAACEGRHGSRPPPGPVITAQHCTGARARVCDLGEFVHCLYRSEW